VVLKAARKVNPLLPLRGFATDLGYIHSASPFPFLIIRNLLGNGYDYNHFRWDCHWISFSLDRMYDMIQDLFKSLVQTVKM
jgi:hypothetical protein